MERTPADESAFLEADRDRLKAEIRRPIDALAAGGSTAEALKPAIQERESEIARIEAKLRQPRLVAPNIEHMREALSKRVEGWKEILRGETELARRLVREILGPIKLEYYDAAAAARLEEDLRSGVAKTQWKPHHERMKAIMANPRAYWNLRQGALPAPGDPIPEVGWQAEARLTAFLDGLGQHGQTGPEKSS